MWIIISGPFIKNKRKMATCRCSCGTVREVRFERINKSSKSCGCLLPTITKEARLRRSNKMKETMLGRKHTQAQKDKLSKARLGKLTGNANPSKRKDVREKISKAKRGQSSPHKGKTYKEIHGSKAENKLEQMSKSSIAHYDLKGRKFRRPKHFNCFRFRQKVFNRDKYTCVLCNKVGGKLNVDHYPKSFAQIVAENKITSTDEARKCMALWDINNGRTLCIECHKKTQTYGKILKYH